ncbi:hypothetical protein PMAYCL1PPCAC_28488, partial [Pristionchus mayeri]
RYNRTLRQIPSNKYLVTLSAMSSCFLLSLLVFWIEQVSYIRPEWFEAYVIHRSRWGCKFLNFLAHFCDFATIWLIVLLVAERFIVLHKKKRALTAQRATRQIKVMLFIGFLTNFWILFIADTDKHGECDIHPDWEGIYQFFISFETVFLLLAPSLIILVSNCFVAYKLQTFLKRIPTSPSVSFHTGSSECPGGGGGGQTTLTRMTTLTGFGTTRTTRNSLSYPHLYHTIPSNGYVVEQRQRSKSKGQLKFADLQLTRSLLLVTWVFLLLNVPNYTYRTATHLFGVDRSSFFMRMFSLFSHVCLYTHHALLFYLYIFYSPSMKRRLRPTAMRLLECYCFKPEPLAISNSNDGL